ncbi:hypothetical protein [Actinoplanes sp. NPDC026670]|uniref:hypothetical protein n=1 Tax=Actinoplanes sp. NPDC026670 TaxID=3154700 RepID=UPI0033F67A3B
MLVAALPAVAAPAAPTRKSYAKHPWVALLVATRTLRREAEFRAADLVIGTLKQG